MAGKIKSIESQIQNIQNNYVSYDDIQPVLDDFTEYQEEVDEIRNNLNDFNQLWNQLFDYEQEQYMMRGG
jgi:predicted RNA-binding protein with EMAP domain